MSDRKTKCADDIRLLDRLARSSPVFQYSQLPEPQQGWQLRFSGSGIARLDVQQQPVFSSAHEVSLHCSADYPNEPPALRFLTDVFHPNVAVGGFLTVADIGIIWNPSLTIDVIVERLWDTVRGAYFDAQEASNAAALDWFRRNGNRLPLDARRIDADPQQHRNVIRYVRRGRGAAASAAAVRGESRRDRAIRRSALASDPRPPVQGDGIVFLDE